MSKVAVHMRIANLNVTNEEVTSRQQAILALTAEWKNLDILDDLIAKANDIAITLGGDGIPPAALGKEVENAIQKLAPAYVYDERPLDVSICAALAALELVTAPEEHSGTSQRDVFAAVLWSALSYQPALEDARREALRMEISDACSKRCLDAAEVARERVIVDDLDETDSEEAESLEDVRRTVGDAIASLKWNATLDREELNFLWWAQLHRSRILKKPLNEIMEPVRLVACALEGAQYLTALPAEVHRELVLRTIDADSALNHNDLLKKIGADREGLGRIYGNVSLINKVSDAFPLLYSLKNGEISGGGAKVVRPCSEWASRALLEGAIAQLYLSKSVKP